VLIAQAIQYSNNGYGKDYIGFTGGGWAYQKYPLSLFLYCLIVKKQNSNSLISLSRVKGTVPVCSGTTA